jgi:hypothetical protein
MLRWRNRYFEMLLQRGILSLTEKSSMNAAKMDSLRRDVLHKIAMELKNDPKKIRVFANRLRLRISRSPSSKEVSDHHWEWYAILTLWPPIEVIKLLEDSSNSGQPTSTDVSILSVFVGRGKSEYSSSIPER